MKNINKFLLIFIISLFCAGTGRYAFVHSAEASGQANITNANVLSRDLRSAGVEAYVFGILGGRAEYLVNHAFVLGGIGRDGGVFEIAWLYGVAYPATSWSWSGAVLGKIRAGSGDMVELEVNKPSVEIKNSGIPRSVEEWSIDLHPKEIKTEHAKREFAVDNTGMMKIDQKGYETMRNTIVSDIKKGLEWCLANKGAAKGNRHLRNHLERVWGENRFSSTVKLPAEAEGLLVRVMSEVFGVK